MATVPGYTGAERAGVGTDSGTGSGMMEHTGSGRDTVEKVNQMRWKGLRVRRITVEVFE